VACRLPYEPGGPAVSRGPDPARTPLSLSTPLALAAPLALSAPRRTGAVPRRHPLKLAIWRGDKAVREKALALIGTEDDLEYRKPYARVWRDA